MRPFRQTASKTSCQSASISSSGAEGSAAANWHSKRRVLCEIGLRSKLPSCIAGVAGSVLSSASPACEPRWIVAVEELSTIVKDVFAPIPCRSRSMQYPGARERHDSVGSRLRRAACAPSCSARMEARAPRRLVGGRASRCRRQTGLLSGVSPHGLFVDGQGLGRSPFPGKLAGPG